MKNIAHFISIAIMAMFPLMAHAQWSSKPVKAEYLASFKQKAKPVSVNTSGAYRLEASLPANYDKTGKKDYTKIIQQVLDEHSKVIFPAVPLLISEEGLRLNNNQYLIFEPGSKLRMKPNALERYNILLIRDVSNITLHGPYIEGERYQHKGKTGQWGAGIGIFGGRNIQLYNAYIADCWGDGVCIARSKTANSEHVKVYNTYINNTRRNGISIVSVSGLDIDNVLISNINGTDPQFGLDIEPDNGLDELQQIVIANLVTYNCASGGLLLALGKYPSQKRIKTTDIKIVNFTDDGSKNGFWNGGITDPTAARPIMPVEGTIELTNPVWKNNRVPYTIKVKSPHNPKLEIRNPQILTPKNKNYTIKEMKRVTTENIRVKVLDK